ncbi:MAG: ADP-ribosylation factor-like protein [Candidatus Roizmanbacteria bacterium]
MGCDISFLKKGRNFIVENGSDAISHEKRILLLGLDNAGKTSILFQMRDKEFKETVPTVGLNIEHILYKRYSLTMWDVGGQATKLWKHYFDHINGIIFVIDSSDEEKLLFASEELNRIMRDESLTGVPILMFYNKCDIDSAKSKEELNTRLQIDEISHSREISI